MAYIMNSGNAARAELEPCAHHDAGACHTFVLTLTALPPHLGIRLFLVRDLQ